MKLFEWNPKFDVGVDSVNKEHQHLIELINNLSDAMKKGQSKEVIGEILDNLIDYGTKHFNNEERLFAQTNYPDAAEHIKEHEHFKERASELVAQYKSGSYSLSIDTLRFLKEWITTHILETDMKYKHYFDTHL